MWVFLSLVDDSESVDTQKKEKKKERKENLRGWSNQDTGVCSLEKLLRWLGVHWSPPPEHRSIRFNGAGCLPASLCRSKATVSVIISIAVIIFNVVVKRKGEQEVRRQGKT